MAKGIFANSSRKTEMELRQGRPTAGDIVIVKDKNLPRNKWSLARVEETFPSADGLIRKARLCIASQQLDSLGRRLEKPTFLERPVHKLVLLQKVSNS